MHARRSLFSSMSALGDACVYVWRSEWEATFLPDWNVTQKAILRHVRITRERERTVKRVKPNSGTAYDRGAFDWGRREEASPRNNQNLTNFQAMMIKIAIITSWLSWRGANFSVLKAELRRVLQNSLSKRHKITWENAWGYYNCHSSSTFRFGKNYNPSLFKKDYGELCTGVSKKSRKCYKYNTFLKICTTLGYVVSLFQELCISSNSRCFTKRLQLRPLNWYNTFTLKRWKSNFGYLPSPPTLKRSISPLEYVVTDQRSRKIKGEICVGEMLFGNAFCKIKNYRILCG